MDDIFLCHECGKVFYKLTTLESHVRWKHSDKSTEYMCDQCGRTFQKKYNLLKHIEVGIHYVAASVKCAAEECQFRSQNRKSMCSHYENYHGICLNETTVYFSSSKEFFDWKTEYENRTRARFVKMSSSRRRKNGIIRSTYLCHRDGNFIPKGKNIRHLKGKGSNKINAHCPAKMEVDMTEKLVTVSYIDTHVGHDLDVSRLGLNQAEKALIAKKLAMKIPFEEILNEINASSKFAADDGEDVKRLNLLTRKDLWNIVETFKIDPKSVVYSKNRAKRKHQSRKGNLVWSKNYENSRPVEIVFDAVEAVEDSGENEVFYCPVIVEGEDSEKYALLSDDNNIYEGDCLVINSQGELESLSGQQVFFTQEGNLQICDSEDVNEVDQFIAVDQNVLISEADKEIEVSIKDEEEVNDCDMIEEGQLVFIDEETYQIERSPDIKTTNFSNASICEKEIVVCNETREMDVKQEIFESEVGCSEDNEENEHFQRVSLENVSKNNIMKYEVMDPDFADEQVNEYVIISSEGELNKCSVISTESSDLDKNVESEVSTESIILQNIDEVPHNISFQSEVEPHWQKKRRAVLNKLLNVHSMIRNEKQLTVLTKNISSLESVLKSLSRKDIKQVPQTESSNSS